MRIQTGVNAAAIIIVLALVAPAIAQQQAVDWCNNISGQFSNDQRITGCTTLIQSKQLTGNNLAAAYENRGVGYAAKRDYARAIADFDQAIRLNPNAPLAYLNRGDAYGNTDKLDLAIADLTRAIRLDPKLARAYLERGRIYSFMEGKGELALADLNRAIALNPDLTEAFVVRGNYYRFVRNYERAVADYNQVVALDPTLPFTYHDRAQAQFNLGKYGLAATDFARFEAHKTGWPATIIWIYVARARDEAVNPNPILIKLGATARSELERRAELLAKEEKGTWEFKLVELFLGSRTPEATFAAASNNDERCQANFFIGQWHVLQNEHDKAVERLKSAERDCVKEGTFAETAATELKHLASAPSKPSNATGATVQTPTADCAAAETHWKSAEVLGILAGYEDHLARFPNCAFSTLAKGKIEALKTK